MKFLEILSNSMELSEEADNIVLSLVFQSPVSGGNGNGKGMFFWALVSGCPTRRGVSSLFPEWQHFPPISQCMPGKAVMVQIDVCSPTCRTYCYPPFGSFFYSVAGTGGLAVRSAPVRCQGDGPRGMSAGGRLRRLQRAGRRRPHLRSWPLLCLSQGSGEERVVPLHPGAWVLFVWCWVTGFFFQDTR